MLGVAPVIGRPLASADDVDGAEPVLVIGHALWRTRFAGSPAVLGRRVTLGGRRFTIVGVMPADLDYPVGVDVWAPTHTVPTDGPFGDAARREIDLVARLRPGTTMAEATAALQAMPAATTRPTGGLRGSVANVRRFEDAIVGAARRPLLALLAAVALVLFVACANVANLQLMRMEGRRGELAVHAALGAGRARLVRQVALEMLMLAAAATAIGALRSPGGAFAASWRPYRPACRASAAIGMDASVAALRRRPALADDARSRRCRRLLLVGRQSIAGALASAGRRAPSPARGRRAARRRAGGAGRRRSWRLPACSSAAWRGSARSTPASPRTGSCSRSCRSRARRPIAPGTARCSTRSWRGCGRCPASSPPRPSTRGRTPRRAGTCRRSPRKARTPRARRRTRR